MRELVFETGEEDAEAISDALIELGALSVTVEDAQANTPDEHPVFGEPGMPTEIQRWPSSRIIVLLDIQADAAHFWREFCKTMPACAEAPVEIRDVSDRDWVSETQRQFTPFVVQEALWVGPRWHDPPPSFSQQGVVIQLDPGMAFGTGSHATTQLCLESLLAVMQGSRATQTVLDMGCGSGILAIAAKKLGASRVVAVDIDPIAVQTARNNAAENQVAIETVDADTPQALGDAPFDLVVANILAQPLKLLAPAICRHVRPGGALLLSGILERQTQELLAVYQPLASHLGSLRVLAARDGWVCLGTLGLNRKS